VKHANQHFFIFMILTLFSSTSWAANYWPLMSPPFFWLRLGPIMQPLGLSYTG